MSTDRETTGWQPIATAPLTARARLVWCPERRNTHLVCWWDDKEGRIGWSHFGGGGRWLDEEPTHWMPLPEPPHA